MDTQTDTNVMHAWQDVVQAEVKTRPWLASLFLQKGSLLFDRFVWFYGKLTAVNQQTRRRFAIGLGTAALALALSQTPAHAATITVTPGSAGINVGDGCSLVEAIINANNNVATHAECTPGSGASDTIVLAGGTYSYSTAFAPNTALPSITSPITIEGNGATIERNALVGFRIIAIMTGNLTLNQATITGGLTSTDAGGGIYNNNGTLTLNNSTVSGNSARYGGGISTVNGTTTINNSTISNNFADTGGGIENFNSSVTYLYNSTISQNIANNEGGGISNDTNSITNLARTIISGNTSPVGAEGWRGGGGIYGDNHNVLGHSGLTNAEAFSGFTPGASDIIATSNGTTPTALGNILNTTLADNGGPTLTHALVTGSPAIDIIPVDGSVCIPGTTADQRGGARANGVNSGGSACDAGAFEFASDFTPSAVTNLQTDVTPAPGQGWLLGMLVGLLGAATAVFLRRTR